MKSHAYFIGSQPSSLYLMGMYQNLMRIRLQTCTQEEPLAHSLVTLVSIAILNLKSALQVVSQADALGEVVAVESLSQIQGKVYDSPTIVVTDKVGGNEDIPVSPHTLPVHLSLIDAARHLVIFLFRCLLSWQGCNMSSTNL